MTEPTNQKSQEPNSKIFSRILTWVEQTRAVIVALTVLVGVLIGFQDSIAKFIKKIMPETQKINYKSFDSYTDCLVANVKIPSDVEFSKWSQIDLSLAGSNNCGKSIFTHVTYSLNSQVLMYRNPLGCARNDENIAECWDQRTIDSGPISWRLTPPDLIRVGGNVGEMVTLSVVWRMYDTHGKQMIRVETTPIRLTIDSE